MKIGQPEQSAPRIALRLWPGVLAVTLQWLARFGVPTVFPDALPFGVISGLAGGLVVLIWWAFFSRAPKSDRWGAIAVMVLSMLVIFRLLHQSIAGGMMGLMFFIYAIPVLSLAFVIWAAATQGLTNGPRQATMVATILLACGAWTLLRTGGITGDAVSDFAWRWSATAEERLLTKAPERLAALPPTPEAIPAVATIIDRPKAVDPLSVVSKLKADWPGFRGPNRNSIIPGVKIETNWLAAPPVEIWRQPIGPGWSSFAVRGDLIYTQEQRGNDELVSCYSMTTGKPVWRHADAARFWESNGGAGPRATPTLSNGRVYTFGATGILNVLDAGNGALVWSRNAATDAGIKVPSWGFAASPLVVEDNVIVAVAGKLAAYDLARGEPRWFGPNGKGGYSSPHLLTIDGIAQILLQSGTGATSLALADGTQLWNFPLPEGALIVQPALTAEGDLLISEGDGKSMHRIAVSHSPTGWTVEERWNSVGLKPYFNDFVVHDGHAFGFDGSILACIDLKDGKRKWKGGRYGHGQLVLLSDQNLLVVLSEDGELALVSATPDKFTELAKIPAIEGKTWNHPVLAGDVLLARNGQEMVAFRLTLAQR